MCKVPIQDLLPADMTLVSPVSDPAFCFIMHEQMPVVLFWCEPASASCDSSFNGFLQCYEHTPTTQIAHSSQLETLEVLLFHHS